MESMAPITTILAGAGFLCWFECRADGIVRLDFSAKNLAIAVEFWHGSDGIAKYNLRKVA